MSVAESPSSEMGGGELLRCAYASVLLRVHGDFTTQILSRVQTIAVRWRSLRFRCASYTTYVRLLHYCHSATICAVLTKISNRRPVEWGLSN